MKLEFYRQIFKKYSYVNFHEKKKVRWEPGYSTRTFGQAEGPTGPDKHDKAKIRLLQLCETV